MSCAHCKSAIEDALQNVSGVEKVEADPDSKVVEVAYDEDRVEEKKIQAAIEDAGYTVAA
jgi:copper chaperone